MATLGLGAVDGARDGKHVAALLQRHAGGNQRARLQRGLHHQSAAREACNQPVALRKVCGKRWGAQVVFTQDHPLPHDLVRQSPMLFRIDPVQPGADHRHSGDGVPASPLDLQRTGMRRGVNTQRHAGDYGESGLCQCLGEIVRIGGTLRRGIAAAHDGHPRRLGQVQAGSTISLHLPGHRQTHGIQHQRRVFYVQQAARVGRIAKRQHPPALPVGIQPSAGGVQQFVQAGRGFPQGVGQPFADHRAQVGLAAVENGLRKSEGFQQLPRTLLADARGQGEPQPSGHFIGVSRGDCGKYRRHHGPASTSPTRTPSKDSHIKA